MSAVGEAAVHGIFYPAAPAALSAHVVDYRRVCLAAGDRSSWDAPRFPKAYAAEASFIIAIAPWAFPSKRAKLCPPKVVGTSGDGTFLDHVDRRRCASRLTTSMA